MCGIAGYMIAQGDWGRMNTAALCEVLAIEMMDRGKDATGILTVDAKGRIKLRKAPTRADVFLASREGIGLNARTALIHARAATQGSKLDPLNNHPIHYENVIGIHNGIISNDDELFAHYGWQRKAAVDSEAIFAALHHLELNEALESIDGGWAIGWIDVRNPHQLWMARGSQNPLHFSMTKNGSVIFASTAYAVTKAMEAAGVTGKPIINTPPCGWVASTDPDNGGLIHLPKFDGSGKKSAAPKVYGTSGYSWKGRTLTADDFDEMGGWASEAAASNLPRKAYNGTYAPGSWVPDRPMVHTDPNTEPMAYHRIYDDGADPEHPVVGDERHWRDSTGEWYIDYCCSPADVRGRASWKILSGPWLVEPMTAGELALARAENAQRTDVEKLVDLVGGALIPFCGPSSDDIIPGEAAVTADADDDDDDDGLDQHVGDAKPGDSICLDLSKLGLGPGNAYGLVLDIDPANGRLFCEWDGFTLYRAAPWRVMASIPEGA